MTTHPFHLSPAQYDPTTRAGLALFGLVMILGSMSLVGVSVYTIVSINIDIAGQQKRQQEAFFNADGGIMFTTARINQDLESSTMSLGASNIAINYTTPAGFEFDIPANLERLHNDRTYTFRVAGRSGAARATIEAVIGQDVLLGNIGIFGDDEVRLQPGFQAFSYDSTVIANPTPMDSTGAVGVGSNIEVTMQPGAAIDGRVMLGAAVDETPAVFYGPSTVPVSNLGRIDPDPLGAVGGALAVSFDHYRTAANNDNAVAGIVGNEINLGSHDYMAIGSGIYYLTDFRLGSHADFEIFAAPGNPVVIFLEGPFRTQPSSTVLNQGNSPRAFYIFSNSDSEIRVQPNSVFMGIVYAPYAELRIQPNSDAYGMFWGDSALLQPNGNIYIDTSAQDDFLSGTMNLTQWKEVR